MTLSLSRSVNNRLPPSKSDSKGLVTSMLLSRPRGVNIQNARERPGRVASDRLLRAGPSVQFRACCGRSPSLSCGWKRLPWRGLQSRCR
jgi:hypothetical protein